MSVAVLGSINLDVVCVLDALPRAKETALARRVDYFLGGKGANQAAAASKLGAETRLIGAVGGDQDGAFLLQELARLGVGVGAVAVAENEASGRAFVFVDAEGQNTIVVAPGVNAAESVLQDDASGCDVLLAQFERPIPLIQRAFAGARDARWRIINAAPFVPAGRAAFPMANVLLVNEVELCGYAGAPADDS
ncbi:MAG: PfkB family carbohydrate kinase, partial [Hyphomonadaceae bacterium]